MSTVIQINSLEALERLIGNDNQLEIEIRNSIVQKFTKKHLKHLVNNDIAVTAKSAITKQIREEFFDELKHGSFGSTALIFKELVSNKIKDDLRRQVQTEIKLLILELINEQGVIDSLQEKLNNAVNAMEDRLAPYTIETKLEKLVQKRIKERLGLD